MALHEVTKKGRAAHLALFDATTLIAKGVKDQLAARRFPVASVRLYTSQDDADHNLTEFRGEPMLVSRPDPEALGSVDIAFLCGTRDEGARYLDWPAGRFTAIDLTGASVAKAGVPLVHADVNLDAIAGRPDLVATPHPIAYMLSGLLAPVQRDIGLERVAATVMQPASDAGEAGIEELYQQTTSLMNFQDLPTTVFGRQLAFNLLPAFVYEDGTLPGGARPAEIEREVAAITGGTYELSVETLLAPVFHCHSALAHVVMPAGASRQDLERCFRKAEGIHLAGPDEPPTPVDHAGKSGLLVAGLRPAARPSGFWVWAVADNLVSGTAQNAVRIAESLLARGFTGSGA